MRLPLAPDQVPADGRFPAQATAWIRELLGELPPVEAQANCAACPKLPPPGVAPGPEQYDPRSKCCTYLPALPNHLVGAILEDASPENEPGRRTVEARIDAGLGVTPLGLLAPEEFAARYGEDTLASFGRDLSLRCPHYLEEGGSCSIWAHREATCATWHCTHEAGEAGAKFWRLGLYRALHLGDLLVSRWAALQLGASDLEFPKGLDARAFYRKCAQMVGRYTWDQVETLGGAEAKELAESVRALHRAHLAARAG